MTVASVAIVTDSAACIPATLIEQYQIHIVPYYVHLGSESYQSGVDLQPQTFFERLRVDPDVEVHTGTPSAATFLALYERLSTWASGIVSVHLAGKQSNGYQAAELASRESPIPVSVIDSETTAMAEGFIALEAAREAATGASLDEVTKKAQAVVPNVGLLALLENITYVLKGGHLGGAVRMVGDLLKIQPLVRVQHNRVGLSGQARRRSKGIRILLEKIAEEAQDDPAHITVHYAEDEAEGYRVLKKLKSRINCIESYLTHVPIELGAHAGPGALGVAYYIERENRDLREHLNHLATYAKGALRSRFPGWDK